MLIFTKISLANRENFQLHVGCLVQNVQVHFRPELFYLKLILSKPLKVCRSSVETIFVRVEPVDKFGGEKNIELGKISVQDISSLPCVKAQSGFSQKLKVEEE